MDFEEFKEEVLKQKGNAPITITDEDLFKMYLSHVVIGKWNREQEKKLKKR